MKKTYKLSKILKELNVQYKRAGAKNKDIFEYVMPFSEADESSLVFFNKANAKTFSDLLRVHFAVILLEEDWGLKHFHEIENISASIFIVKNPHLVVSRILSMIYPSEDFCFGGIHSTAFVHSEAKIHSSVSIGPYCIIGNCEIGENSRIYSSVVIKDNTVIGKNVIVREFCLIGGTGFGHIRDQNGYLQRMPHMGRAIIEDDVELLPFVNVDRGTLNETRIKKGTKIDHYCHIGHNCIIGEHCIITAKVVFCGGSSIGCSSFVGVGSIIKDDLIIGFNCLIGMGSVVTKNIEAGTTVYGNPAKEVKK